MPYTPKHQPKTPPQNTTKLSSMIEPDMTDSKLPGPGNNREDLKWIPRKATPQ